MRYLYGDSTPFPLVENFLVTLCAVTEACVGILRADELADEGTRLVRDAEARVTRELAQLSTLARRVEDAFGVDPGLAGGSGSTPTEQASARICELAWSTLKQARADVLAWRDGAVAAAAKNAPHALVLPALNNFLVNHQLPDTAWSLRWRGGLSGAATGAEVYARTPLGLEATFDVDIPATHLWSRPVRVMQLEKDVTIMLTRARWFGKPRPAPERLDKLFITSVIHTPDRAAMRLQRSGKEPSAGIEIVVRNGTDATDVTAVRVDENGAAIGSPELLSPEDVSAIHRVWARLESTISDLVVHRRRMTGAVLGGVPVGEIVHPEAVAEMMIESVAPLVREIAARSNANELALKRFLGDGRREELFIPYEAVLGQVAELSDRHQSLFDAFGLRSQPKAVIRRLPPPTRPPKLKVANA